MASQPPPSVQEYVKNVLEDKEIAAKVMQAKASPTTRVHHIAVILGEDEHARQLVQDLLLRRETHDRFVTETSFPEFDTICSVVTLLKQPTHVELLRLLNTNLSLKSKKLANMLAMMCAANAQHSDAFKKIMMVVLPTEKENQMLQGWIEIFPRVNANMACHRIQTVIEQ